MKAESFEVVIKRVTISLKIKTKKYINEKFNIKPFCSNNVAVFL